MKKITTILICLSIIFIVTTVSAFDISDIRPDDSFITSLGRNTAADLEYLRNIAEQYNGKYVVTEEQYLDITSIDMFYYQLSAPLSLEELDAGKAKIELNRIGAKDYQKQLYTFKVLGSLAGYSAEFEPIGFFKIYRNIAIVGGYVKYNKIHFDPNEAYWQYVCAVEAMTREVIPYETRLKLIDKFKTLSDFIDEDKTLKIFILQNGKIDSMYDWSGINEIQ